MEAKKEKKYMSDIHLDRTVRNGICHSGHDDI